MRTQLLKLAVATTVVAVTLSVSGVSLAQAADDPATGDTTLSATPDSGQAASTAADSKSGTEGDQVDSDSGGATEKASATDNDSTSGQSATNDENATESDQSDTAGAAQTDGDATTNAADSTDASADTSTDTAGDVTTGDGGQDESSESTPPVPTEPPTTDDAGPVANPDATTTYQGEPASIYVLDNDTGTNITLIGVSAAAHGQAKITNPCTDPSNVNCVPYVSYTPDQGFTGTDNFTYVITDDQARTATGTVTITVGALLGVGPAAPVANPDTATTPEGQPVAIYLTGNDVGADLTISSFATPVHGTLQYGRPGPNDTWEPLSCDQPCRIPFIGYIMYIPDQGFAGTDSFTYTVFDKYNRPASSYATVTVVGLPVVNPDTPTATPTVPATTPTNKAFSANAGGTVCHRGVLATAQLIGTTILQLLDRF